LSSRLPVFLRNCSLKIADALVKNSGRERTSNISYAVRTAGILQLLLGNIGRPGGGIMALRGHANIQGSTDIPTLYNLLPRYLMMPSVAREEFDCQTYLEHTCLLTSSILSFCS
jgi:formate dehydrogenase major subunit